MKPKFDSSLAIDVIPVYRYTSSSIAKEVFNLNNDKIVWPITKVYKLCDANKNIASALQKNFYSLLLNNNSEFKLNSNGIKYYSEMIKLILKK